MSNRTTETCPKIARRCYGQGPETRLRALGSGLGMLCLAVSGCGPAPTEEARYAPAFEAQTLDGQTINLEVFRGKMLLLNFWATWCAPCKLEMPEFIKLYAAYGGRELEIVGFSVDYEADNVRAFVDEIGVSYPIAMATEQIIDAYHVGALPVTFLIDGQGQVQRTYYGPRTLDVFETDLRQLLATGALHG